MRANSRVLPVTKTQSSASAWAAIASVPSFEVGAQIGIAMVGGGREGLHVKTAKCSFNAMQQAF